MDDKSGRPPTIVDGLLPVSAQGAFHTLEYRHIGSPRGVPASAPVLVFLHEGLGSVSAWRDFPAKLCERCQLPGFVYSRPGYGRSSPANVPRTPRYLHDEALDVLPAVLDAAGIEQCVLVGHSDGASIALIFAGSHHAVGRLVALELMAPHVFNEPESVKGVRHADTAWQSGALRDSLVRHHGEQAEAAFSGWRDIWLSPRFRRWNIEACLPSVQAPVLLVQGADDQYGSSAQLDAIERGLAGPVARAPLLPGCGHAPFRECPGAVLALCAEFVAPLTGNIVAKRKQHTRP